MSGSAERRSPLLVRSMLAGLLGAALVLAWWGVFRLAPGLPLSFVDGGDFRCDGLGCAAVPLGTLFVNLLVTITLVFGVSTAVSWPLLRMMRVDPAWPVVLLGPAATLLVAWIADGVQPHSTVVLALKVAVGYGLTAFATAPDLARHVRTATLLVVACAVTIRAVTG